MIKEEPRMDIKDIFAILFVSLGLILFLTVLHILSIETTGNTSSVLNTIFTIALNIFRFLLVIGMAYLIIHFLKWLVWSVNTPAWKKNRIKQQKMQQNGGPNN